MNYDAIPTSLTGIMGEVTTLEHKGSHNTIRNVDECRFKRMDPWIAIWAVGRQGDTSIPVHFSPTMIIECHTPQTIANPRGLRVVTPPTRATHSIFMHDHFIPRLVKQLQKVGGTALVIMGSATARMRKAVL